MPGSRKIVKSSNNELEDIAGYDTLLNDLRTMLDLGKTRAYQAVDNIRVQTYWQIGERIDRAELEHRDRADYGKRIMEHLARDLGFSKLTLYRIIKFYRLFPIVSALRKQLSWRHYVELLAVEDEKARAFYEQQTVRNRWSTRELNQQIASNLYNRIKSGQKIVEIELDVDQHSLAAPEDIFKDVYNFQFLDLHPRYNETELKKALVAQVERFLRELGRDFFFGGREVSIPIAGNYDKIDLELFHAGLLCYVLVEVKTEPFKAEHIGQLNSYLNWYKENMMKPGQNSPVGLLICRSKDEETVHYALGGLAQEIFVAEYLTRLPKEEQILDALEKED
ncbi:MAG TPA: PDDEXK nuclease domain-containing protein [Chloroflexia bacterium]|nr:PDDEXK nuclease domain-containing protein [Chloroflexia bacterium]